MKGAEFNTGRMAARANEGSITVTELADTLAREQGLAFRSAHAIATRFVRLRAEHAAWAPSEALARASREETGSPLELQGARIDEILSPEHFVRVRTTFGGPAPTETGSALDLSDAKLQEDRAWLEATLGRIARAEQELRSRAASL
jgi:argininosuccinate lyase